jgi:hypothetical protein
MCKVRSKERRESSVEKKSGVEKLDERLANSELGFNGGE